MGDLYSGKAVTFKIPNGQSLVDNRWISQQDRGSAIVVKAFEVFLPTKSPSERTARVEAKVVGWNQHEEGESLYNIVPEKTFISEYKEGQGATCRNESDLLTNPSGSTLPKICPLDVDEYKCQELLQKTALYPSIYYKWEVSITGYESVRVPNPANRDFRIKVGVQMCILDPPNKDKGTKVKDGGQRRKRRRKRPNKERMKPVGANRATCPRGQYWSIDVAWCAPCPEGSKPALDGYYCEKITTENKTSSCMDVKRSDVNINSSQIINK